MKIKKALWASIALAPAAIIPLATASSCSQAWGFKTPLSIGTSIKGGANDPYKNFEDEEHKELVDLNGDQIVPQLQSNYAIDTRSNGYYAYSLPEKWDSNKEYKEEGSTVTWDKGDFVDGNAGWYDYNSDIFVKSATRSGTRNDNVKVSEGIYSYRNNTLSSNIQLVSLIGTSISSYTNYALSYQGTQIGSGYAADSTGLETSSNLATSWGGNLTHGAQASEDNRIFFESIFASNAVSGTGKSNSVMYPTHVEFKFNNFPIPAYAGTKGNISGVNELTNKLLNATAARPSVTMSEKHYWSAVTDETTEQVCNIRTDKKTENKYRIFTFTNVPVVVTFDAFNKTYVNPTKTGSYIVSDYYSDTKTIKDTIGNSWAQSLPKFATSEATAPKYSHFTFVPAETTKTVEPLTATEYDQRLTNIPRNSFVALINYAYKVYSQVDGDQTEAKCKAHDRVTMTGLSTIFPSYLIDKSLKLGDESTFFKKANEKDTSSGYVIDVDKINKYNNLFLELMKRSAGQGLVTEANNLNATSKQLLKYLAYMFGDDNFAISTNKIIHTDELA